MCCTHCASSVHVLIPLSHLINDLLPLSYEVLTFAVCIAKSISSFIQFNLLKGQPCIIIALVVQPPTLLVLRILM